MSDPLRIGLMTPAWPGHNTPNGITTSVFNLALGLHEIGHTPVILTGEIDGEPPRDIPVVINEVSSWTLGQRLRARLQSKSAVVYDKQIEDLANLVRTAHDRHGLNAVIMEETNGWPHEMRHAVPVPIILNLHGPWKLLLEAFERTTTDRDRLRISRESCAFETAPGLMAPSASSMAATEGLAPDTPRAVIPNAYPLGPEPDPSAHKPGHILFVGRVDRLKGADTVLQAFAQLVERQPMAQLTFAGPDRGLLLDDGRVVTMDEALAELPDIVRARIDYLGSQDSSAIAALRRTHPIALTASRYENLNYTLLEAMAAGQAIVSTKVGGPAEVLTDGVTASLVPPGDADAMAAALERVLTEPDHAKTLAKAARAMIASDFTPDVIAERTIAFCRTVLARPTQL